MYAKFLMLAIVLTSLQQFASAALFDWSNLPAGEWVRIPTHGAAAPKVFHGGAAIIPERNVVIFCGSDTHEPTPLEKGESNAVWRLDLETLTWSQDYAQDPKSTYRLLPDGQTETTTGRPWAMHTFAAMKWDPQVEGVVVVSGPLHARFSPEERFPMFRGSNWWEKVRCSHWEYDIDTRTWTRLSLEAPNLFAETMAWDPDRGIMVGHDGSSTWEFDRAANAWTRYAASTKSGWHLNMVYDTLARRMLLLGNQTSDNTLFVYDASRHAWDTTKTTGTAMPANGAAIAYDTKHHVMLYLANDAADQYYNPSGKAVTFLYHSDGKRWERLDTKSPELYGMNYLMQYDSARDVILHFEKSKESGDRIAVWAFRHR